MLRLFAGTRIKVLAGYRPNIVTKMIEILEMPEEIAQYFSLEGFRSKVVRNIFRENEELHMFVDTAKDVISGLQELESITYDVVLGVPSEDKKTKVTATLGFESFAPFGLAGYLLEDLAAEAEDANNEG
mmetsp:Transcript_30228/g.66092  ORF Transcript_30228/g.66092 Transcript_30228/m.66092 type:complete len:129 (-) Transcript_30228:187-573(-)